MQMEGVYGASMKHLRVMEFSHAALRFWQIAHEIID